MTKIKRLKLVKRLILAFIVCLFISGLTAIPVEPQLEFLLNVLPQKGSFYYWIQKVLTAYQEVDKTAPFLLYGYDWLAFAHFVLAILFIGPYRNPLRNIWVIEFGLIACVLVIPYAFVAGYFRGISIGWRIIDCSFGVVGFGVLWVCYQQLKYIFSSLKSKQYHESI